MTNKSSFARIINYCFMHASFLIQFKCNPAGLYLQLSRACSWTSIRVVHVLTSKLLSTTPR